MSRGAFLLALFSRGASAWVVTTCDARTQAANGPGGMLEMAVARCVLAGPRNKFLEKMLQRLYAALSSGPALNCRPHQSRQRVDLAGLAKLAEGVTAEGIVKELLSG